MIDQLSNKAKTQGYNAFHLGKKSTMGNSLGKYYDMGVANSIYTALPANMRETVDKVKPFIDIGASVYDAYNNKKGNVHQGKENSDNKNSAERTIRKKHVTQPVESVMVRNAILPEEVRF